MSQHVLYGIPNCDTVKKARRWLDEQQIPYRFHDLRKDPPSADQLRRWFAVLGMDTVINRRGTTWRTLDDASKADLNEAKAIALLQANPSLIKRPVLAIDQALHIGFSAADYARWTGAAGSGPDA